LTIEQYAWAGAWGSLLEIKMCILADNTPTLERMAHARLEEAETAIVKHFAMQLKDG
jgi:hypothetical protein